MNDDELKLAIRAQMRRDLGEASRLVAMYGRRAARNGNPEHRAEARFLRAEVDMLLGRLRSSARAYEDARRAYARLRLAKPLLAAEIGSVQVLAQLGDATRARRMMRAMRARVREPFQAALAENAIGSALGALGDETAAETAFRNAIRMLARSRTQKARMARATAHHNLAIRLVRRGAVAPAIREFERAHRVFAKDGLRVFADRVRHNRAWALGLAGRVQEAMEELAALSDAFDRRGAALVQVDAAEIALRLGAYERAAHEASAAARRLPPLESGRARLLAAQAHRAAGNAGAARRMARSARAHLTKAGDRAGEATADVVLGENVGRAEATLRRMGHWIGALDALLQRDLPPAQLARAAKKYPVALRRWVRPQLLLRQATSVPELRCAFRAAEDLRRLAPAGALRAGTLAAHLEVYETLAQALLERATARDRREAFLVIDALRSRTLREEMESVEPGLTEPAAVRALRRRLEQLWLALERNEGEPGDLRTTQVRVLREVSRCEREYIAARERLERSEARDAGARLPEAPCLAFAVLGREVVGMLCSNGKVTTWDCGSLRTVREHLDAFAFQVTRRLHGARDSATADACLDRLRGILLPDVDLPEEVHAVLPPELGAAPLEGLAEGTRFIHLPYACARGRAWRPRGRPLVVGIESQQLPEIKAEIAAVARRLDRPVVLRGSGAGRKAILTLAQGRSLLHLAGHAAAREDLALLSALRVRDGWITAADLSGLDLTHSLVVLSACRTGDPSLRWNAESLGGFPRALLAAGAAGLVASRWDVPDETARIWMIEFYRHLKTRAPAEALALAARDVRARDPHPAAWTAFLYVQGGVTGNR